MARRFRREFQALESLLEPDAVEKQWRAFIDDILYNKGPGAKSIVGQFRLRERLRTLNARRDRYNDIRHHKRHKAFIRLIQPQHVLAAMAIRMGIVKSDMNLRDMFIGALAGDRRLSRRWLDELETVYETLHPSVQPWGIGQSWIEHLRAAKPAARAERIGFEKMLMPTPVPDQPAAAIPYGFCLPQTSQTHDSQARPPAARAAS